MSLFTNFPVQNPFYGGLTHQYGTGLHVDQDATTGQKEYLNADKLNRIELRIQRIEYIFNQLEHELMWPSGVLATTGFSDDTPASGEYYLGSRLDYLASGVTVLVNTLISSGIIEGGDINYHPFYAGSLS